MTEDAMTREEVLERLKTARAGFDLRVRAIPRAGLDVAPRGRVHTPKEIVAHVSAYERLIVERLRAAREGRTTAFDRDREGWEAFNDRVWREATTRDVDDVLAESSRVFGELLEEVERLSDEELAASVGVSEVLDPEWLQGRALWELIGIDGFEHYAMHFEALEESA